MDTSITVNSMNSRERVLATIKGEITDRIPSSFRAENAEIVRLQRDTGMSPDQFMDRFDVDIRNVSAKTPPAKDIGGGIYQNYWGERYALHETVYGPVRDDVEGALAAAESLEELMAFPWISNDDYDYSDLLAQCERYSGRAIQYGSGDVWQRPGLVRGMGNFLIDMYEEPEFCHFLSNKFTEFYVEDYRRAYEYSKGKIDIFAIASDLGTQRAPLISVDMFREFVAPYLKRVGDVIHELGACFFFHSCGMVEPFIPDLIACGVDIIDPIQPCNDNLMMTPEHLAAAYGGQVCFHGGIDIQNVLINGMPDDVRAAVDRYRNAFQSRGYICCPSHSLQVDINSENVIALYEAILKKERL